MSSQILNLGTTQRGHYREEIEWRVYNNANLFKGAIYMLLPENKSKTNKKFGNKRTIK